MHQLADIQGTKANISVHFRPRIGWETLQLATSVTVGMMEQKEITRKKKEITRKQKEMTGKRNGENHDKNPPRKTAVADSRGIPLLTFLTSI